MSMMKAYEQVGEEFYLEARKKKNPHFLRIFLAYVQFLLYLCSPK